MRRTSCSLLFVLLTATAAVASSPQHAVAAALLDARALPPTEARRTRYLSAYHMPEGELDEVGRVLSGQLNQVSSRSRIAPPRLVAPGLWAIRVTDYGPQRWADTWEKQKDVDPYFHQQVVTIADVTETVNEPTGKRVSYDGGRTWVEEMRKVERKKPGGKKVVAAQAPWLDPAMILELAKLTNSEVPVVRADWWFVQSARQVSIRNRQTGVGYYDWLGLKDRGDLFKLVVFDEKKSIEIEREIRAALDRSGVAQMNRQIVRFQSLTGGVWITLDTDDDGDRGNAVRNLPRGTYKHKAEEIYAALPNRLPVYWAGKDDGTRQDSAPDFIGPNDSRFRVGKDGRIHVCLTCMGCHDKDVLQPINDYVRRNYSLKGRVRLSNKDPVVLDELISQYFADLDGALEQDRAAYVRAIREATGLDPGDFVKAAYGRWNAYAEKPVTIEAFAAELGVPPLELRFALTRDGAVVDPILAPYMQPVPGTLPRTYAEDAFPIAEAIMRSNP